MRPATPTIAPKIPGTLDLQISDPVTMLNEVARRYETTERVLMEYIDNALDDAEILYRENGDSYPYEIHIEVILNFTNHSITVKDNCRGMKRDILERTVQNVGESHKRGLAWVNGRFGFGVHSFRAAAETIQFQTRHANSPHLLLNLQRQQYAGIKEAKSISGPFPSNNGTGTIVTISNFETEWFENVSVNSIKQEVENHFDRLLARDNLSVTVRQDKESPVLCVPYQYSQIPGKEIQRVLQVAYKEKNYPVEIYLKIADANLLGQQVSFFSRGRRVNPATEIKSFMRKSTGKSSVWGHPHLIGYINAGEIVQPTITRHDFVRTKARQLFYEQILTVEKEIKALLGRINQVEQDATFDHLENALGQVLERIALQEWEQFSQQANTETDKFNGLDIQFIELQSSRRACLKDGAVCINTNHPDFSERLTYSRQGQPRISDRLGAYIAALITVHYKGRFYDQFGTAPEQRGQLFDDQIDFTFRLESAIRKQLPNLERQLRAGTQ